MAPGSQNCINDEEQDVNDFRIGHLESVGSTNGEHFEFIELVPDKIYQGGDTGEVDCAEEVKIEHLKEEVSEVAVDPLSDSEEWSRRSKDSDRSWNSQHGRKESLESAADEMAFSGDDSVDEEWMEETEIEYTAEDDSGPAVDPLGDARLQVFVEQKTISDNPSNHCDRSTDDFRVDQKCFVGNTESVLFVDVYSSKSKETRATETERMNGENDSKPRKSYACRLCDFQTTNRYDIQQHCRAHYGEKSFEKALKEFGPTKGNPMSSLECSVCSRKFSIRGWLMRHMKKHEREQSNPSKTLSTKRKPRNRSKKMPSRDELVHRSSTEDEGAQSKDACDDHNAGGKDIQCYEKQAENQRSAGLEKPYACKSCEYRSSHKHNLKKHELSHNVDKPYQCDECSYSCRRAGYLKFHRRAHHDTKTDGVEMTQAGANNLTHIHGKLHSCTICHYTTRQMGNLRVHVQTHSGEKPYPCGICHKAFTQAGALKIHTRVHTGERPYLCNVCGLGFSQISNRGSHKKKCAYIPRTETCYICNYRCTTAREFRDHMNLH